jgi:hypothetical protein
MAFRATGRAKSWGRLFHAPARVPLSPTCPCISLAHCVFSDGLGKTVRKTVRKTVFRAVFPLVAVQQIGGHTQTDASYRHEAGGKDFLNEDGKEKSVGYP